MCSHSLEAFLFKKESLGKERLGNPVKDAGLSQRPFLKGKIYGKNFRLLGISSDPGSFSLARENLGKEKLGNSNPGGSTLFFSFIKKFFMNLL